MVASRQASKGQSHVSKQWESVLNSPVRPLQLCILCWLQTAGSQQAPAWLRLLRPRQQQLWRPRHRERHERRAARRGLHADRTDCFSLQ
jgi:hypothetical protein